MTANQQLTQSKNTKFQGDGFVIEDCIIKGEEKVYPCNHENIGELLLETLSQAPERIVQIEATTGIKKTCKDLKERSIRLAIWLKKEAISTGDVISICSQDHPHIDSIILATTFVGATYIALFYDLNLQLARDYIGSMKPRVMITCKNKVNLLQEAAKLENHDWKMIILDGDDKDTSFNDILIAQSSDEVLNFQIKSGINPTDICMIMPTSGTTGNPKHICYSYETCMRWALVDLDTKNPNRITLSYFNPDWIVHFRYWLKYFLDGSTQIFHAFDPYDACRVIEKYKVNTLVFITYYASLLTQTNGPDKYDLQSVSLILPVGTRLYPTIEQKLRSSFPNAVIVKKLGSSETQCLTSSIRRGFNRETEGTVIANIQLKIANLETGSTLGHNQIGEICCKTPYIMTGYYKNPPATKLAFDNEGWFHTGDTGYYDENGEIIVVGRLKEVIKFRNADIHPSHVEQLLLSHPNIVDTAVVGIHHEVNIERPIAFVKTKPGSNVTEDDIMKLTHELECNDALKNSVIFVDEIPRSANGKIQRYILRQRAEKFYANGQNDFYLSKCI